MFAQERQEEIVALVNKDGSVRVKELSEKFNVTEDSIRKDLTLLEKQGLLEKTYGGAIKKKRVNVHDFNISQRKDKNIEAKQKIAARAIELIKDGDMVFLDISTTNVELSKLLVKSSINITVVTNMVDVMLELRETPNIDLVFIGGTFNRKNDGFIGSLAMNQIQNYRFDIAFLGTVGVDLYDNSVATYMVEDGLTKQTIIESSRKTYLMLESRKFDTDGNYKYARVDEFTGIIMDQKPESSIESRLKKYNLEWVW